MSVSFVSEGFEFMKVSDNTARPLPLKEDFYYISLEKGAHYSIQGHRGSLRFSQDAEAEARGKFR